MHPILFEMPLPLWQLPLFPTLLGCALLGLLVIILGWKARAKDLLMIGCAGLVLSVPFAFLLRGEFYLLSPFPLYGYGTLLALSFILGWVVSTRLARKSGMSRNAAASAFFATALSALLGARLLYVLTNLDQFARVQTVLDFHGGGLAAYGGFLGGLIGAWAYSRHARVSLLLWADAAAPAVALGLGVTRIGCYLFGCDYGRRLGQGAPSLLRDAGTFPRWDFPSLPIGTGAPAWQHHVEQGWVSFDATESLPVHPTQLYESALGFLLFVTLIVVWRRRAFPGQLLLTLGMSYGAGRFLIEYWRDDPERGLLGPEWSVRAGLLLALIAISASFLYGPVSSGATRFSRGRLALAALGCLAMGYAAMRIAEPTGVSAAPWSTSQWLGLLTAVFAGTIWRWRSRIRPGGLRGSGESESSVVHQRK